MPPPGSNALRVHRLPRLALPCLPHTLTRPPVALLLVLPPFLVARLRLRPLLAPRRLAPSLLPLPLLRRLLLLPPHLLASPPLCPSRPCRRCR